ncbi:hypothetical protein J7E25_11545 [Agromyces sp. ISL-38]|uniref:hypothetical protein n=1 Tax=Agromyces sp. ISL-38 TaxID=2819107 RepID=UPI001BE7C4BF|nr:hypothetical protein [Agromyces sp. ISL-38]MBT2499731.1 hypothetical protein [Agromyces sp. ISL-38]MBT2516121.1 hypothetical protein [Streptomyces sp. ISL-90]
MLIRRAFYRWQFIAVVALPVWLAVGWAVFGGGGWGTLGLVVVVPVGFIALGVVALLTSLRPTVREQRAASWMDLGIIGAWHAAIVATGFYGATATLFAVLAILLAIAAFWLAVWQLVHDGARRVQASMAEFERLAAQQQDGTRRPDAAATRRPPFDDGGDDVIIVREVRD